MEGVVFPPDAIQAIVKHATPDTVAAFAQTCHSHMLAIFFFALKFYEWGLVEEYVNPLFGLIRERRVEYVTVSAFLNTQLSKIFLFSLKTLPAPEDVFTDENFENFSKHAGLDFKKIRIQRGLPLTANTYFNKVAFCDYDKKWLPDGEMMKLDSKTCERMGHAFGWIQKSPMTINLFAIKTGNLRLYQKTLSDIVPPLVDELLYNIQSENDTDAIEIFLDYMGKVCQQQEESNYLEMIVERVVDLLHDARQRWKSFHPLEVPQIMEFYREHIDDGYHPIVAYFGTCHGLYDRLSKRGLVTEGEVRDGLFTDWREYDQDGFLDGLIWEQPFLRFCALEFIFSNRYYEECDDQQLQELEEVSGIKFPTRKKRRVDGEEEN